MEGYAVAFRLWKWLLTAKVRGEAGRGVRAGGGGGRGRLPMGQHALKRQREQLRCGWKFRGAGGLTAPRWFLL